MDKSVAIIVHFDSDHVHSLLFTVPERNEHRAYVSGVCTYVLCDTDSATIAFVQETPAF